VVLEAQVAPVERVVDFGRRVGIERERIAGLELALRIRCEAAVLRAHGRVRVDLARERLGAVAAAETEDARALPGDLLALVLAAVQQRADGEVVALPE